MKSLLPLAALLFAAPPAFAQDAPPDFAFTVRAAVLGVCTRAFNREIDLNDAAATEPFGLTPSSAEEEAAIREQFPDSETAQGDYPDHGHVILGYKSNDNCWVIVTGPDTMPVRDTLLKELRGTGAPSTRQDVQGGTIEVFDFNHFKIAIQTNTGSAAVLAIVTPSE